MKTIIVAMVAAALFLLPVIGSAVPTQEEPATAVARGPAHAPAPPPAAPPAATPAPAPAPAPKAQRPASSPVGEIDLLPYMLDDDRRSDETPEQYARRHRAQHEAMDRMRRDDPKRWERLLKIRRLCIEYRHSEDPKRKAAIEKELSPLVEAELRIQQENNKKRVADLERRLDEAKKVLDERDDNWDKVVDFSVKEITGQNAYLRAVHHHDRGNRNRNRDRR